MMLACGFLWDFGLNEEEIKVKWLDLSLLHGLLVLCSAPRSVGKKRMVVVTDQGAVLWKVYEPD